MIRINFCSLPIGGLFYPFIELILPIYWVLISLLVRVWRYEFWYLVNLLVEIYAITQQTLKLQLSSTTSNSILSQDYNRSKDPLIRDWIKQQCRRGYLELLDLIHNDRSFVNFELYLVKVIMYLLILISDIDVVWFFINELNIIKKNTLVLISNLCN